MWASAVRCCLPRLAASARPGISHTWAPPLGHPAGTVFGIIAWLVACQCLNGRITIDLLGGDYPMLAGARSLVAYPCHDAPCAPAHVPLVPRCLCLTCCPVLTAAPCNPPLPQATSPPSCPPWSSAWSGAGSSRRTMVRDSKQRSPPVRAVGASMQTVSQKMEMDATSCPRLCKHPLPHKR